MAAVSHMAFLTVLTTISRGRDDGLVIMSELCDALGADRPTLTPLVRELERNRLVHCWPRHGAATVVGLVERKTA
jgi:DNA-binding MarR family transcriptional regulator